MSRSKKIFVIISILFALLLLYISYDFSTRTTFPGSHKDSTLRHGPPSDSLATDSLR